MNRTHIAGSVLAGITLLLGKPAMASYVHETTAESQDTFGNSDVYGGYDYYADERGSLNMWENPNGYYRLCRADADFGVTAGLFGGNWIPLHAVATGYATQYKTGTSPSQYSETVSASLSIMGSTMYSVDGAGSVCPNSSVSRCASYDKVYSATLISGKKSFSVGPVPVTVSAGVNGSVHGRLDSSSYAAAYLGGVDQFYGLTTASLNAHGILSANFGASAGIDGVAAVGVTATINLVDAAVTPSVSNKYVTTGSPGATIIYSNSMPLTFTTMSGSVDAYATLIATFTTNIVSWPGKTYKDLFYSKSGTLTYGF